MSVLCYFPWNLRLQSAVRLLFPILPEDIIHPVSWLKSGISARLDNLDLRTYAFPFEKVALCLEHNLSFLFLFLCSFGKLNIPEFVGLSRARRYVWLIVVIIPSLLLLSWWNVYYLPIFPLAPLEFRTMDSSIYYFCTPWRSPSAQSDFKSVNQTDQPWLRG